MKRRLSNLLPIVLFIAALAAAVGIFALRRQSAAKEDSLPVSAITAAESPLVITEFMCRNSAGVTESDGSFCQWIELKNISDSSLTLSSCSLAAGEWKSPLPDLTVAPGSLVLLRQSDWGFLLPEEGTLSLLQGNVSLCTVTYKNSSENCSWLCSEGAETPLSTPGYEEVRSADQLFISEVMSSNDDCVVGGRLCDWVELYNAGNEELSLDGYYLSKDINDPYVSPLPAVTLLPGEYAVLCCGSDISFNISKSGAVLYLTRSDGVGACALAVPALQSGESFTYDSGIVTAPSPGRANEAGYIPPAELCISEVLSSNDSYFADSQGEYCDLVELYNAGSEALDLSEFFLSDSKKDLFRWQLPEISLAPGAYCILRCSGRGGEEAPFRLSADGEELYLSRSDGYILDALTVPAIPSDRSWGRSAAGLVYFASPTPGKVNGSGQAALSAVPLASHPSGAYEDAFTVTLSAEGSIYYTTDGSTPDERSKLYRGEAIAVKESMSLRAYCRNGECIPSEVVTYNYFFDLPEYELDVVKVSVDPQNRTALTWDSNTLEYSANIALYSRGEEQFSLPCGVSIFGSGSRAFMKKSYQIDFQGDYGPTKLDYPLFENREYTEFDSIVLRSGSQDQHHTVMRDEVLTTLWEEISGELLTFSYRPVNLYLNEEYVGVYHLRERCTPETVAARYDVDAESVSIVKNIVYSYGSSDPDIQELMDLLNYIRKNDMRAQEHYGYVEERLDMESTIDFFLSQMWSTNYDIGNARMFRSGADNGRWHFILYDLDVAFMQDNSMAVKRMVEAYNRLLENLLANEDFKEQMTLRLGELLAGPLQEEAVLARVDTMADLLRHDMDYNVARWRGVYSKAGWEAELEALRSRDNVGITGWNDTLIRQYIAVVRPDKELIREAFGEEYC